MGAPFDPSRQPLSSPAGLPGTISHVFFAIVERDAPRIMLHRGEEGWVGWSSREFYRNVVGVARALRSWGIARGDRVAILGENRPEWAVADFASLLLGAATVPIYPTLTPEQTVYLLRDSEARLAFVSSPQQLSKVLAIKDQTMLEKVVLMDAAGGDAEPMIALMQSGPSERDAAFDRDALAVMPDDLATLIYTSGTTGVPKGVMLTHGNLASNFMCSLDGFDVSVNDISLSFLPLSHITARHVDLAVLYRGGCLAYVPVVEQLPQALKEVQPTFFVAVPRVYEKIFAQTEQKAAKFPVSWIYGLSQRVGQAHREEILAGREPASPWWQLCRRLVYDKIRAGMGGRVRIFISGGAPLGRELAEWYATMGIRIHEGYGLTETSPVIAVNSPNAHRLGTVGQPLSNLQVRIADDGEILVRGPSVFARYWKKPEETEQAFVDGWFKTGDIGNLDADGFLSVTDRKKDLIKTSGGKFIAPQPIENSLKHHPLVAEAVVVGDAYKFPAVLIAPNFSMLEEWCRANQISFSSRKQLVEQEKICRLYEGIVAEVNEKLARFEKLKRVLVVSEEFTAKDGALTASMKLRRKVVVDRYRQRIEEMYAMAEAGEGLKASN